VGKALRFAQNILEDFMHDRREMMVLAAMGALIPEFAFAADPVIPADTIAAHQNAPVVPKKVNKLYNLRPAVTEPNDMQFAANDDLWILDQKDPNKVFTIDARTGAVKARVQTESIHGSGITYGDGAWFITSTKVLSGNPSTLKVDPKTGATLKKWETPGWGVYGVYTQRTPKPGDLPLASGGHGVKWAGNGQYWMAVPASGKLFLINAEEGTVARSIQAPTVRTHGIALEDGHIWCVGSDEAEIYKLQMSDGAIVAKIVLDKVNDPSLHGLDIKDGVLWYCDANKGWICNLT
jgi:outer membrane protein assembly factor BamB